jgi:hypothetical protein
VIVYVWLTFPDAPTAARRATVWLIRSSLAFFFSFSFFFFLLRLWSHRPAARCFDRCGADALRITNPSDLIDATANIVYSVKCCADESTHFLSDERDADGDRVCLPIGPTCEDNEEFAPTLTSDRICTCLLSRLSPRWSSCCHRQSGI